MRNKIHFPFSRYDFAQLDWRQVQMMLTFRSGGLAIAVYAASLVLTLTTTP